jgi:PAS domain-containing protein
VSSQPVRRFRAAFHRRALAAAPVPLVVVDRGGTIAYANDRAGAAFDLSAGIRLVDRVTADVRETAAAWLSRAGTAVGTEATFFATTVRTGTGAVRHVHATATSRPARRRSQ